MAGHHDSPIALDPAYVKYASAVKNRYKYFRWTARTAKITFGYAVVVPALIGILAYSTEGKYEMRGKRRGDTIAEY